MLVQEKPAICLMLKYLGPRKRKPQSISFFGEILEEAKTHAKEFIIENKGRFIAGNIRQCTLKDLDSLEGGKPHRMFFLPMFCPSNLPLSQEEIEGLV